MMATSGIGVVTQVTLRAHGCVVGRGTAFPFVAAFLGWAGGQTGATVRTPLCASVTNGTTKPLSGNSG